MIGDLRPISLEELNERASLLTRVDRKYLLPIAELPLLLTTIANSIRVLDTGGRRQFAYRSEYFDSPGLTCYLDAAHRRRRRFKVRIRSYLDSGAQFVEVKTRGPRGSTIKRRNAYSGDGRRLGPDALDFVQATLARSGCQADLTTFDFALSSSYQRTTLFLPRTNSRVTIDTEIAWSLPGGAVIRLPEMAVVESKSSLVPPELDRVLWSLRYRPCSVSKYGTGLAALRPDLPAHRWRPVLRRHFSTPPDWKQQ
jgi:hypothetical protein